MYYLLMLLLILIVFYVATHLLSSVVHGCLITIGVGIIGLLLILSIKSTQEPVKVFNYFVIENLEIRKVQQ